MFFLTAVALSSALPCEDPILMKFDAGVKCTLPIEVSCGVDGKLNVDRHSLHTSFQRANFATDGP